MKEGDRVLDFLKWGHTAKNKNSSNFIINIRSEDAGMKPTFRPFINKNRCVVMCEGYYEWDSSKNPHSFKNKDNKTIFIAALFTYISYIKVYRCKIFHLCYFILSDEDNVMVLTREAKG